MIDILLITHVRAHYLRLSLPRLLESATPETRLWIWHNGSSPEVRSVFAPYADHPSIHAVHDSPENVGLLAPTNWILAEGDGTLVSKVDDDCLVTPGWLERFTDLHESEAQVGVIGSWRFEPEDFIAPLAERKLETFPSGHRLMLNAWVQGSGFLMKRQCVDTVGLLSPGQSFTRYCINIALAGYKNGWYFPFVREEHMDDPRAPHTQLKTDDDFRRYRPLSANRTGASTLADWAAQMRRSAWEVQRASPDPRAHVGWRRRLRRVRDTVWAPQPPF